MIGIEVFSAVKSRGLIEALLNLQKDARKYQFSAVKSRGLIEAGRH